ncbi:MAG: creatininase family protein [Gammaproteobacteria bacterium]|nr:creatininase family protein [Gammaproteobacteria bacterium]MDH3412402.1 creatininase family protein [Gammaproteobacteria bacterium]
MLLHLCTWQEIEAYLERSKGVIVPIGSTEQHGPNGLLGTDAICPEVIARGVGENIGALVAPTLSIGMAQHHLGFAGSVSFRPTTLIAVVRDVVQSLARHGFERCYFLNGHGGNIATVTAAFSEIYADKSFSGGNNRPQMRCKLSSWYMAPEVKRLSAKLFGSSEGSHATPSEVSLTYFAYPEAVKSVSMSPKLAPTGPIYDADDYRSRFPDGRIGSDPTLASVDAGRKLFEAAVVGVARDYEEFLKAS